MRKKLVAVAGAIALLLASPQVSMAKSIKELLTPQQLADFCTANGLGEKSAQITLPDNTVVTGRIDCEEEDLLGAAGDDTVSSSEGDNEDLSSSSEEGADDLTDGSEEDDNNGPGNAGASSQNHDGNDGQDDNGGGEGEDGED